MRHKRLRMGGWTAFLLAVASPALATVLVPADQPTIQAGINAAAPGETVLVAPGTYFESSLTFGGKDVVLVSSAGAGSTVIDGGGAAPVFVLTSNESRAAVIEGFTITNGFGTANFQGGGFLLDNGASPTIRGNRIVGNASAFAGGGLKINNDANPLLVGNLISGNTTVEQGGALHIFQASATLRGNTIEANTVTGGPSTPSPGGGGVKATFSTAVFVHDNVIHDNSAPFAGGGISAFASDIEIVGNQITDNEAANGGGIHIETQVASGGDRTFVVRDNLIRGNRSTASGGGIHSFMEGTASSVLIHDNEVLDNICVEPACSDTNGSGCCKGGGIMSFGGVDGFHDVRDNLFAGNQADVYGAAAFDNASAFPNSMHLRFYGNQVRGNHARFNYSGVACLDTVLCDVRRNRFSGNSTQPAPGNPSLLRDPGALFIVRSQSSRIENNFFFENQGSAGAVHVTASPAATPFVHNTFADNVSTVAGNGTVRVESPADFHGNIFSGDHHAVRVASGAAVTFTENDFHGQPDGIVQGGPNHDTVASLNSASYASDNLAVPPGFLDPTADEYWLGPTSNLLGAAPCGAAPANDVDGDPRPIGSGCDTGADERHVDTEGLFAPATSRFYLRAIHAPGAADRVFQFGPSGAGWSPVTGDWDGDRVDTAGLFDPARSLFLLRNANSGGAADIAFAFGPAGAGWLPLAGDWNGDGIDTIGLYKPSASRFYLKNTHAGGAADLEFGFGSAGAGWLPIVGDWDGDGADTIGLYDPSRGLFLLRNSNSAGAAEIAFRFGPAGAAWIPLSGDWDGDAIDTVGLFDSSRSLFLLINRHGGGAADITVSFGPAGAGWFPLGGRWGL